MQEQTLQTGRISGMVRDVWRGGVATWECDEMGHMNTRFYAARCMEGAAMLFGSLGLPGLLAPQAPTTLSIRDMHIRFLHELRAGTSVHISAGITGIGADTASMVATMFNSQTGEAAATFRISFGHVAGSDGVTALPWPDGFVARASAGIVDVPPLAMPRGVGAVPSVTAASLARADALGLGSVGMGAVDAASCDPFGRMLPQVLVGAMGDGVRNVINPLRQLLARHSERQGPHFGAAALEFQILNSGWPRAGDCYEIRSGLEKADTRTMSLINWMLDPFSGRCYASMQVIAIAFDLEARKLIPISVAALAEMGDLALPSLAM